MSLKRLQGTVELGRIILCAFVTMTFFTLHRVIKFKIDIKTLMSTALKKLSSALWPCDQD